MFLNVSTTTPYLIVTSKEICLLTLYVNNEVGLPSVGFLRMVSADLELVQYFYYNFQFALHVSGLYG